MIAQLLQILFGAIGLIQLLHSAIPMALVSVLIVFAIGALDEF